MVCQFKNCAASPEVTVCLQLIQVAFKQCLSAWHNLDSPGKRESHLRNCLHQVWPVGMSVWHFLDSWLILEGPATVHHWDGPGFYKKVSWATKQHFFMVSVSFSASSSCLEFLLWLPLITNCKQYQVSLGQCSVTAREQPCKTGISVYQEMPRLYPFTIPKLDL